MLKMKFLSMETRYEIEKDRDLRTSNCYKCHAQPWGGIKEPKNLRLLLKKIWLIVRDITNITIFFIWIVWWNSTKIFLLPLVYIYIWLEKSTWYPGIMIRNKAFKILPLGAIKDIYRIFYVFFSKYRPFLNICDIFQNGFTFPKKGDLEF